MNKDIIGNSRQRITDVTDGSLGADSFHTIAPGFTDMRNGQRRGLFSAWGDDHDSSGCGCVRKFGIVGDQLVRANA